MIDASISCRETERRMRRLGLDIQKIKAIFISHEHSDHIRGVEVLSKKYGLPVYITGPTLQYDRLSLEPALVRSFKPYEPVFIGELSVLPFPKSHDASDPHSFTIECRGVKVGVLTDIGTVCRHVADNFSQCHAAFLEANYDEEMLEKGRYPNHLKNRIRSDAGHLSNAQSLELFRSHRPAFMSLVLLSHLSQDNNNPELAASLFRKHAGNTRIDVASRHKETRVYHIPGNTGTGIGPARPAAEAIQMNLF